MKASLLEKSLSELLQRKSYIKAIIAIRDRSIDYLLNQI